MITRDQIYGKEVKEILRYVTTYHCIARNQLLRIYPDREKQIDNLLKYLLRQGRIFTSPNSADIFFDNSECPIDREMLAALWVYADFSDRAEYHYAGEFPVGFAQCQLRRDYVEGTESSPVGYLEGIYVVELWRKQGLAKALLAACEGWAKGKGCTEFASDCELDNTQSLQFHLKAGFREANRIICFTKKI